MLRTIYQAYLFDLKPQPPDRRMWQAKLLFFPVLLLFVGHLYLAYFYGELMEHFTYTLGATKDEAEAQVQLRQKIITSLAAVAAFCLGTNRLYLSSFTVVFIFIAYNQVYDNWHRFMLDRSLITGIQAYRLDYLFMLGIAGNVIRISFLLTVVYAAWATLKKNMELMTAQPH